MKIIGLNLKEKLILALAALILIASAIYLLTFEHFQKNQSQKLTPFGKVQTKFKNLKRKNVDSMIWEDIDRNKDIFLGDKIFTSEGSNAVLKIGPSSYIEMSPLTLIQLKHSQTHEPQVELQDGSLKASLKKEDINSIQTRNAELNMAGEGADFLIDNQKVGGSIVVLSGAVLLSAGDKKQEIKKNQAVRFSDNQISAPETIDLMGLAPSSKRPIPLSHSNEVFFNWKTLTNKKEPRLLEISNESSFRSIIKKITTDKFNEKIDLSSFKPGTYFWRIKYLSDTKDKPHTIKFSIFNDSPPRLLSPIDGQDLYLPNKNPIVLTFLWEDVAAQNYRFETNAVMTNKDQKTTITLLQKNEHILSLNQKGPFWWRVQAIFDGDSGPWSEKKYLNIQDESQPMKASYQLPQKSSIHKTNEHKILFRWLGTAEKEYTLLIAKDETFKEIIHDAKSSTGTYEWNVDRTGLFYWKVISNKQTNQTDVWKFTIEKPEIVLLSPYNQTHLTNFERGTLIDLRWTITNEIDQGESQLKTIIVLKNGIEILKTTTKQNLFKWLPKEAGKYSWWVEYLDSKSSHGEFEISFSQPLKAPQIQKEIRSKIKRKKNTSLMLFERSNRHIANLKSLEFDEGPETVTFAELKWDSIPEAKEYQLNIFRDKEGKELIISRRLFKNFFHWLNAPPGNYFFRVSFTDKNNRKSPFSEISRLIVEDIKDTDRFIQIIYPKNKFITSGEKFGFEWKPNQQAQKYTIIIKDFKERKLIKKIETLSNSILTNLDNGIYRWQVIGFENDVEISMSEERLLKIVSPKIMTNSSSVFIDQNMKNFIEADFLLGQTNSISEASQASTKYKNNQNLQLFPSSFKMNALLKTTYDMFLMTSLEYKNASNNDVNFLTDVDISISPNWIKKLNNSLNFFYGPGIGYNSLSVVNEDTNKNIGSSLNYLHFSGRTGIFYLPNNSINHQLWIDAGFSFITVNSKSFSLNYDVRLSKIRYLKKWKKLFENLYLHSGISYHYKEANNSNNKLSLASLEIPAGVGYLLD